MFIHRLQFFFGQLQVLLSSKQSDPVSHFQPQLHFLTFPMLLGTSTVEMGRVGKLYLCRNGKVSKFYRTFDDKLRIKLHMTYL